MLTSGSSTCWYCRSRVLAVAWTTDYAIRLASRAIKRLDFMHGRSVIASCSSVASLGWDGKVIVQFWIHKGQSGISARGQGLVSRFLALIGHLSTYPLLTICCLLVKWRAVFNEAHPPGSQTFGPKSRARVPYYNVENQGGWTCEAYCWWRFVGVDLL